MTRSPSVPLEFPKLANARPTNFGHLNIYLELKMVLCKKFLPIPLKSTFCWSLTKVRVNSVVMIRSKLFPNFSHMTLRLEPRSGFSDFLSAVMFIYVFLQIVKTEKKLQLTRSTRKIKSKIYTFRQL